MIFLGFELDLITAALTKNVGIDNKKYSSLIGLATGGFMAEDRTMVKKNRRGGNKRKSVKISLRNLRFFEFTANKKRTKIITSIESFLVLSTMGKLNLIDSITVKKDAINMNTVMKKVFKLKVGIINSKYNRVPSRDRVAINAIVKSSRYPIFAVRHWVNETQDFLGLNL